MKRKINIQNYTSCVDIHRVCEITFQETLAEIPINVREWNCKYKYFDECALKRSEEQETRSPGYG